MKYFKCILFMIAIFFMSITVQAKTTEASTEATTEEEEFKGWDNADERDECYNYLFCTDWDQIVDDGKKYVEVLNEDGSVTRKERTMRYIFTPTTIILDNTSLNTNGTRSALRNNIVDFARSKVGNHYVYGGTNIDCTVWGGTGCTGGTDCSGFTQTVMSHFGITLPRTAEAQYEACKKKLNGFFLVKKSEALPGDLMFFFNSGGYVHHVAIYAGNKKRIHAWGAAYGVVENDLGSEEYAVGRVITNDFSESEVKYMAALIQYCNETLQNGNMTKFGMGQLGHTLLQRWELVGGEAMNLSDEELNNGCSVILSKNLKFTDSAAAAVYANAGGEDISATWTSLVGNAKSKYVNIAKQVLSGRIQNKVPNATFWLGYSKAQWYKSVLNFKPSDVKRVTSSKLKTNKNGYYYEVDPLLYSATEENDYISKNQTIDDALKNFPAPE